ncbi:uncharacterized protein LOC128210962 [Mya arenaria]|uniref:uncharacterized protein LOC128210962 n=1 Tax=Mya arenaria TaxID=6604 RepID=UPI0022E1512A|nr:uncharacterized protein LOC128210962 [Mya arenaria]
MRRLLFMCMVTICSLTNSYSTGHTDSLERLTEIIARQYHKRQRPETDNVEAGGLTPGLADSEAVMVDSESENQYERNLARMKDALMKEKQWRRMSLQGRWINEDGGFRGTSTTPKKLSTTSPTTTTISTTTPTTTTTSNFIDRWCLSPGLAKRRALWGKLTTGNWWRTCNGLWSRSI